MIERDTDLQIGTKPLCTIHDVVCSTDFGNGIILYKDDCLQAKEHTFEIDLTYVSPNTKAL